MDTEAGRIAYQRTNARNLQYPSDEVKATFTAHYRQAEAEIETRNLQRIAEIKEILE